MKNLDHVYLQENHLIGCQSHDNTKLKFRPGLNVIIARNNTGKSVFMKMCKVAVNPKYLRNSKEREAMINNFHGHAEARYLFSDGACGIVQVYSNRVNYYYTPRVGKEPLVGDTVPCEEFISKMSIVVDEAERFYANMLDSDQDKLFIDTGRKTQNQLIAMVTRDERLDKARFHLEELEDEYMEYIKKSSESVYELEFKLDRIKFVDVDTLEREVNVIESGVRVMEALVESHSSLEIMDSVKSIDKDYDLLVKVSDLALGLMEIQPNLKYVKELSYDVNLIDKLAEIAEGYEMIPKPVDTQKSILLSVSEKLIDGYEMLADIKKIKDNSSMIQTLNVSSIIRESYEVLKDLDTSLSSWNSRKSKLDLMERRLSEMGEEVACPIYGRIRHVEDHCIPVSDGFALEGNQLPRTS